MTAESELKAQSSANPSSNNGVPAKKFDNKGVVRPFLGNTVIAPLPQNGKAFDTFDAFLDCYRDMARYPWAKKLTYIPTSGYHITLLQGANDQDRNKEKCWPAGIPRDAAFEKVTSRFLELIHQRKSLPLENLVFIPKEDQSCAYDHTVKLLLVPADENTRKCCSQLREELGSLFGMEKTGNNSNIFHMTLAYFWQSMSEDEVAEMDEARNRWAHNILAKVGEVVFPAAYFCEFKDMFAFRELTRV